MKHKLVLLFLNLVLANSIAQAQIENEIISFVDSTELLVTNGRKLMVQNLQYSDIAKTEEVYHYLHNLEKAPEYHYFYYTEELALNVLFQDWQKWIDYTANYHSITKWYTKPNMRDMVAYLHQQVNNSRDVIDFGIRSSSLSDEEVDMLNLYLYMISIYANDEEYNEMLKSFKKKYPQSKFNDFIRGYMPHVKMKSSFTISMGPAYIFPQKALHDFLDSNMGVSVSMDFNIGKVFASVYMNTVDMRIKRSFSASTENHEFDFEEGEKFIYFEGGFLLGYFAVRSKHFHVAPYVAIAGASVKSNRFENDEDKYEYKAYGAFTPGLGLHTEFKLARFRLKDDAMYTESYLSIKLEGGYNFFTTPARTAISYLRMSLVWGFGDF